MKTKPNQGLSGKARRAHQRSRASRDFAQQLIDDFLEPDPSTARRHRPIPVRYRSDLTPAEQPAFEVIAPASVASSTVKTGDTHQVGSSGIHGVIASHKRDGDERDALLRPRENCKVRIVTDDARAGARRRTEDRTDPTEVGRSSTHQVQQMSLTGFLYGCLIGGAAAAMILVVIRASFS